MTSGSGDDQRTEIRSEALYRETAIVARDTGLTPASAPVLIAFDLPDDPALSTALCEHPGRYWELELTAPVPGTDFAAAFLVPVYARR